jgi:hypothetical protein
MRSRGDQFTFRLWAVQSMERCSMKRNSTASGIQSLPDSVRTRTRKAWSRNTETKPNFHWVHSWWWFRAQTSALQQATPFLGAAKREAATIPPMAIRRNTSTLNGTFIGDRCFPSSVVSSDARRGKDIARTCDSEWSHGTAAPVLSAANALDGSATPQFSMMRSDRHCHANDVSARLSEQ